MYQVDTSSSSINPVNVTLASGNIPGQQKQTSVAIGNLETEVPNMATEESFEKKKSKNKNKI